MMNIYIGNLSQQVSEQQLEELFKAYGSVSSVKIIRDMFTGESKGFAFVEMKEKGIQSEEMIFQREGEDGQGNVGFIDCGLKNIFDIGEGQRPGEFVFQKVSIVIPVNEVGG